MQRTKKFSGFSLDTIWFITVLAGTLFITSIIPLIPNDYWWHLKIGEWIFTHKAIPTTNMYAWTLPAETPYFYGTWLGELLLYILFYLGGLKLTIFIKTILFGTTLWLSGYEAKRYSGSWRISAFVTALAFLMMISNLQVRTQMWSWLTFIAFFVLLNRFSDRQLDKRWLLLLPAIMVFWVNVHGAFILGLVLVSIYLLGEIARNWFNAQIALSKKDIQWLTLICLLTYLATLANPRLINITGYVIGLLTDKPSQLLVVEWQSPKPQGFDGIAFFVSIILLITLSMYSQYRLTPSKLFTCLAFLWLAWSGIRYVTWYAIVIMPILAQLISQIPVKKPSFTPQRNYVNILIVVILLIPVVLVQPWFVEKFPLPETYQKQVLSETSIGPLLNVDTPVAAVAYLKLHPGGKLFHEMGFGSYLIWEIPEQGVFVDPRVELYPYEQWQDYVYISSGINYNQLLNKYGADRLLLSTTYQKQLLQALENDPLWELEYQDQYSQILRKMTNEDSSH